LQSEDDLEGLSQFTPSLVSCCSFSLPSCDFSRTANPKRCWGQRMFVNALQLSGRMGKQEIENLAAITSGLP
jgi:hypothetical protein